MARREVQGRYRGDTGEIWAGLGAARGAGAAQLVRVTAHEHEPWLEAEGYERLARSGLGLGLGLGLGSGSGLGAGLGLGLGSTTSTSTGGMHRTR